MYSHKIDKLTNAHFEMAKYIPYSGNRHRITSPSSFLRHLSIFRLKIILKNSIDVVHRADNTRSRLNRNLLKD